MISDFYKSSIESISIIIFYALTAIMIAILVINKKINDNMRNNDINEFEKNIKIQKGLLWTNYSIVLIYFIMYFIISIIMFSKRRYYEVIYERKTGFIIRNVILFCIVLINTGMTYYMNKILNEIKINDKKDELNKIYIITTILYIVIILLVMETFSKNQAAIQRLRNYYIYEQPVSVRSITRTSPISTPSLTPISRRMESSYVNDLDYDFENDFY
jgi:hypothetical protein